MPDTEPERRISKNSAVTAEDTVSVIFTVYAFSTENWSRPDNEVSQLMKLFVEFSKSMIPSLSRRVSV